MTDTIVEFFGPPAAGKSTLARAVATELRDRDIQVTEPTYKLEHERSPIRRYTTKVARSIETTLWAPALARDIVSSVTATGQPTFVEAVKNVVNWLYLASLIRRHKSGILVFDQGLLQATASVLISCRYTFDYDSVLSRLLESSDTYLVVEVIVDLDMVDSRLSNRACNPSRVGRGAGKYTLRQYMAVHQTLGRVLHDNPRIEHLVVRNETSSDIAPNVESVVRSVLNE